MKAKERLIHLAGTGSLLIREASPPEGAALVEHFQICGGESNFLTFGAGDYDRSAAQETALIRSCALSDNQLYLTGWIDDMLAASLKVTASARPRLRHSGQFGVVVRKQFWGLGVGPALLDHMLSWASSSTLKKISLRVRVDNRRAIELYERLGFVREGTLRRDILDGSTYHDVLAMSIMVEDIEQQ